MVQKRVFDKKTKKATFVDVPEPTRSVRRKPDSFSFEVTKASGEKVTRTITSQPGSDIKSVVDTSSSGQVVSKAAVGGGGVVEEQVRQQQVAQQEEVQVLDRQKQFEEFQKATEGQRIKDIEAKVLIEKGRIAGLQVQRKQEEVARREITPRDIVGSSAIEIASKLQETPDITPKDLASNSSIEILAKADIKKGIEAQRPKTVESLIIKEAGILGKGIEKAREVVEKIKTVPKINIFGVPSKDTPIIDFVSEGLVEIAALPVRSGTLAKITSTPGSKSSLEFSRLAVTKPGQTATEVGLIVGESALLALPVEKFVAKGISKVVKVAERIRVARFAKRFEGKLTTEFTKKELSTVNLLELKGRPVEEIRFTEKLTKGTRQRVAVTILGAEEKIPLEAFKTKVFKVTAAGKKVTPIAKDPIILDLQAPSRVRALTKVKPGKAPTEIIEQKIKTGIFTKAEVERVIKKTPSVEDAVGFFQPSKTTIKVRVEGLTLSDETALAVIKKKAAFGRRPKLLEEPPKLIEGRRRDIVEVLGVNVKTPKQTAFERELEKTVLVLSKEPKPKVFKVTKVSAKERIKTFSDIVKPTKESGVFAGTSRQATVQILRTKVKQQAEVKTATAVSQRQSTEQLLKVKTKQATKIATARTQQKTQSFFVAEKQVVTGIAKTRSKAFQALSSLLATKAAQKSATLAVTVPDAITSSIAKAKTSQLTKALTKPLTIATSALATATLTKPIAKTKFASLLDTLSVARSKVDTVSVTKTKLRPRLRIELEDKSYLNRPAKKVLLESFRVLIKEKGKERLIGTGLSRTTALDVGAERTLKTLSATFRIEKEASRKDVISAPTGAFKRFEASFREFKIKKGQRVSTPDTFIQKRGTRLGTFEERKLIQKARRGVL